MELSKQQQQILRKINFYKYSENEKKGKPITPDGKEFIIPSFEEILEITFQQILENEFSEIKRVAPDKANCVIRIFKILHYKYCSYLNFIINAYGVEFFILTDGKYLSSDTGYEINYSECKRCHWLCQDDSKIIYPDFFDIYVHMCS